MRIVMMDDSLPFDGYTPGSQPLGGAEKAFASLPGALVRRDHDVQVFNRCRFAMSIEGAAWNNLESRPPLQADALVAFRRPALLRSVRQAARRVLWLTQPPRRLDHPEHRAVLKELRPTLVFQSQVQVGAWRSTLDLPVRVIAPGVRYEYLSDEAMAPKGPPHAVVTTHPGHGLDWLLRLWVERVHPACPEAELHVFSAVLDRGQVGGEVPEALKPVLASALEARRKGVVIRRPEGDEGMARAYRAARVHLYPGHPDDMACATLMETQATGLPAVVRPLGAAPERVVNGETGFVVPDDEAFANLTVQYLTDDAMFWNASRTGREKQRRSWDDAAAEWVEAALA